MKTITEIREEIWDLESQIIAKEIEIETLADRGRKYQLAIDELDAHELNDYLNCWNFCDE